MAKLLTVATVLLGVVMGPGSAQAGPVDCPPNDWACVGIDIDPNHICYGPRDASACEVPVKVVDRRYTPPRPTRAPVDITLTYDLLPLDGPPKGFVPVQGGRLTITAGQTAGTVPVKLLEGPAPVEERARAEISRPSVGTVVNGRSVLLIRRG